MGRIRIYKQVKCLECDKIGIFCKSLCQTCYYKKIRQSPEDKLKRKLYFETVVKQIYLDKKSEKELIQPRLRKEKKLCVCGKISIAKDMCRNCYQKKYNNKNYTYKPKKIKLVKPTDELYFPINISNRNTGKYFQKARVGQSKTRQIVLKEISEYIKLNKDFGKCNYLKNESKVLRLKDFFDLQPICIDMNKIYKY